MNGNKVCSGKQIVLIKLESKRKALKVKQIIKRVLILCVST